MIKSATDFLDVSTWALKTFAVFFVLQALDVLTTFIGLHLGAKEGNYVVAGLMHYGPMIALLVSKSLAVLLAVVALTMGRRRLLTFVNFWFTAVVGWNLLIIAAVRS